jgi:hypothetical protein
MIRRTLSLELESGRVLTLKNVDDGLLLSLGKAEALLTTSEVSELQSAIREVAGSGGPARVAPVQPPVPPSVSQQTVIGRDQGGFTVRPQ